MEGGGGRVVLVKSRMVVPATPTQKHLMFLPALDLFWRRNFYNRRLIFYHITADAFPAAVEHLASSLAQALLHFYPFAGRLTAGDDGRVALDCNDTGVEFIEASTDLPFDELQKDDFRPRPFFASLSPRNDHPAGDEIFNIPLLYIQVTQFLHGGMALGFAHSHVVADGQSLWHFMNSWAECGRGLPISAPPVHQRTVFSLENPSEERATAFHRRFFQRQREWTGESEFKPKALGERLFHFSGQMISKLKEKTTEEGKRSFTSFEALSGYIWKHVTRARQLEGKTPVSFNVLLNFRNRFSSKSLPPTYFGNVIKFESAHTTAEELLEESLAATASRIHIAVANSTEEIFEDAMHYLELHDNSYSDLIKEMKFSVAMMVASSPKFPVYDVDFGWGRPEAVRNARVRGNGEIVLFPGKEGGASVDVCISLPEAIIERLDNDPDFLNF